MIPWIGNFRAWVGFSDADFLKARLQNLLRYSEFNVIDFVEHRFDPFGYTCLWLLAESHLAVHTFPEHSKAYIELSSCNAEKQKAFEAAFAKAFGDGVCDAKA